MKTQAKNHLINFTSFSICNPEKLKCGDASYSDYVIINNEKCVLLIVADGVSTSPKDWLASRSTIEFITTNMNNNAKSIPDSFLKSIMNANKKIFSGVDGTLNMLSTVSALLYHINENKIYLCNAGDSRIYGIKNEQLIQLTTDDSTSKIYKENGKIKLSGGQPIFHQPLTNAIGYSENLEITLIEIAASEYESFILATDGFYNLPAFERYATSLVHAPDLKKESIQIQVAAASEIEDDASAAFIRMPYSQEIDFKKIVLSETEGKKISIDAVMVNLETEIRNAIEVVDIDYLEQLITFMENRNAFYSKEKMIKILEFMLKNKCPNELVQNLKTIIWKL